MTLPGDQFEELSELSAAVREDRCTPEQASQLNARLIDDPSACDIYARYVLLEAMLEFELGAGRRPAEPSPRFHTPIFSLFSATYHGTVSFFSQEIPFALLMATIVMSLGLLVGSMIYVTHHQQIAEDVSASPSAWSTRKADIEFVGRVTGMVDVRWSDIDTSTERGNGVPLGRKYAMASGLMEITYDTGAKVILQGPATYEVDSRDGGYLSIGKLTARLEKKGSGVRSQGSEKVASGQWSVASATNPKSQNPAIPKSQISNPQSPASIFAVRTPTATVTDLGTEFGVEVQESGVTTAHVFRGTVRFQAVSGNGMADSPGEILHENQSARVGKNMDQQDKADQIKVFATPAKVTRFVRSIPKPLIKMLDLVDVVAGGDGFSGRRNAGIDPTTGAPTETPPPLTASSFIGDGKYHRAQGLPFVDGVFIPNGDTEPVQVDSAGDTFALFGKTTNATAGHIWAGGILPGEDQRKWFQVPAKLNDIDYSSPNHTVLGMHANKGITFDLEAIRQANPGWKVTGLRTIAGNTGASKAEIWILVDGHLRFRRRDVTASNGAFPAIIPLGDSERFLTLAATDSGTGIPCCWTMFGDPQLELLSHELKPKK